MKRVLILASHLRASSFAAHKCASLSRVRSFQSAASSEPKAALSQLRNAECSIRTVANEMHDTLRVVVNVPPTLQRTIEELPLCNAFRIEGDTSDRKDASKVVCKSYTAVNDASTDGRFLEFVIKTYENGQMGDYFRRVCQRHSEWLASNPSAHSLTSPVTITIRETKLKINLTDATDSDLHTYNLPQVTHLLLIAGGTGIAPMVQVLHAIANGSAAATLRCLRSVTVLNANVSEADVLCRKELNQLADGFSERSRMGAAPKLRIEHIIEDSMGRITVDCVKRNLPADLVMVCGKPEMLQHICGRKGKGKDANGKKMQGELEGILKQLGFTKNRVFKF